MIRPPGSPARPPGPVLYRADSVASSPDEAATGYERKRTSVPSSYLDKSNGKLRLGSTSHTGKEKKSTHGRTGPCAAFGRKRLRAVRPSGLAGNSATVVSPSTQAQYLPRRTQRFQQACRELR